MYIICIYWICDKVHYIWFRKSECRVESLMIERTMHLPYIISDLSIWQFIVLLYLFYLIISVMISIIGLLVSKISRGNIEAFSIMSVIIVGVSYILNILWLICNDFSIKRLNMPFADFERAMQKAGYKLPELYNKVNAL